MKKMTNETHLEGYLFSHNLSEKESGPTSKNPGTPFIMGTLYVATDDEGMNVIPVNFRYVTETFGKSGKKNTTYTALQKIINGEWDTFEDKGVEAQKIKVDTALGLNDFVSSDNELVSYKINDGGFVHPIKKFSPERNAFYADILITKTVRREADEERETPETLQVSAFAFNFRNDFLPVELVVKSTQGMDYIEELGATSAEPVLIKVWGKITHSTIETQTVEESAFGEDAVKISVRNLREWEITGAAAAAYEFGDEAVLTAAEVKEGLAAREVFLADVQKRYDEYQASKKEAPKAGFSESSPEAVSSEKVEDYVF